MRNFIAAAITSLLLLASPVVMAQEVTIDPFNLIENILGLISSYSQEATEVENLYVQYQSLENQAKSLSSLGTGNVAGIFGTVNSAYSNEQRYFDSSRALYGDVNNAGTVASDLYRRMGASGLSSDEWAAREAERNKAAQDGNGFLNSYQADVLKQVGKRYEEVRDLQGKITSTDGEHEDLQLMNSQMNVLVATVNQLLEYNATVAQRQTNRDIEIAGREKASLDGGNAWQDAQRAAIKATRQKWESMGSSGKN